MLTGERMQIHSTILLTLFTGLIAASVTVADPPKTRLDPARLAFIEPLVAEAIEREEIPGCVILLLHHREVAFLKAFGNRGVEPAVVPMTTDTVFDMASITKPVATATSAMILVERGLLRIRDPVSKYLPEFAQNGKEDITVHQLLTHQAGFVPDSPLSEYVDRDRIWDKLMALGTVYPPGSKFVYSDVGFQVLGRVIERVAGQPLNEFAHDNIFEPLGMHDTGFLPDKARRARAAPTEQRDDEWMVGEVHDPRAYAMGGVAGHAGLFSTAQDLARYAAMMLGQGQLNGQRILSPAMVRVMTHAYPSGEYHRGLGWDKRSKYSENRGETMSEAAFGHGGFTGTAMWIDPELNLAVILLSNRVHPDGSGTVNRLAGQIATIAAGAVAPAIPADFPISSATESQEVLTGIDVLERDGFELLQGKRVGLITNHTGRSRAGQLTSKLLHSAPEVELVCLFSPEHGIAGVRDDNQITDARDETTGLPIYSLYGERRTPASEQLDTLDALVFDIQDVGARFYTYISTMGNAMRVAAERGIEFVVLDRPNPIGGIQVSGPVLDPGRECFVGFHPIAVRHGMTVGELATMFRAELDWSLDLHVVPVENWSREQLWDDLGLAWVNPSPNMRNAHQALLYPGIGLLETSNISVGRGTDTPFEILGAPWVDGRELAQRLNAADLTGLRCVPIEFTPTASKYRGERCEGVRFSIVRRDLVRPLPLGLEVACALRDLYEADWQLAKIDRLLLDQATLEALRSGANRGEVEEVFQQELGEFEERRKQFLLYP